MTVERIALRNRGGSVVRLFQVPEGAKSRTTRRAMRKLASEKYGKPWGKLRECGYRVGLL
jgi:hypothetical protein